MLIGGRLCKQMNALDLSTNQQYPNKIPAIKRGRWIRNQIANLYNFVSASEAAIREALTRGLQSVRESVLTERWIISSLDE